MDLAKSHELAIPPTVPEWVRSRADVEVCGVVEDRLPCADGFSYDAEVRYRWRFPSRPSGEQAGMESDVRSFVLARVGDLARAGSVLRSGMVESTVNAVLRNVLPARVGTATVMAAHVHLTTDAQSQALAQELDLAILNAWRESVERKRAKHRVEFFRDEILKDPASARLYLLLASPMTAGVLSRQEEVERLVEAVVAWHPDRRSIQLNGLLQELFANQSAVVVEEFLEDFRVILRRHRQDLVEQFDAIDFSLPGAG